MIVRKTEREILLSRYQSNQSELVVVYGRRRIGKTYLINNVFEGRFFFCFTGLVNSNKKETLHEFTRELKERGLKDVPAVDSWFDAFAQLRRLVEQAPETAEKKVIFLDEMPWMDTHKSRFLAAFEYFFNGWASSRKDILLIVCGSMTSWIIKKILFNKGGLYNRATCLMKLKPFTLAECAQFYQSKGISLSAADQLESYMVFGGVPYYHNLLEPKFSLAGNIDQICFGENAKLVSEFERLFSTMFIHNQVYIQVIETLYKKKKGLTRAELITAAKLTNGGALTTILKDLEDCDFIRSYRPFNNKKQNTLYQLYDPFLLFHLNFLADRQQTGSFWSIFTQTPAHNAWSGYAFEMLCLHHLPQIQKALGISGVITKYCSWYGKYGKNSAQIDLVLDRADNVINICEMKFTPAEFELTKAEQEKLVQRRELF
ncbi:MAG: ATP-binding protein [Erysipelotrichaceae bacterium]|jgi:AAA+ ATPase superfamily predicted ATPase|nr:ATP-binding protein [Erysipelotrichaceae bacterium]